MSIFGANLTMLNTTISAYENQFIGAAQEVTGSKHLITTDHGKKILLDCGMFQGKGLETDAANRMMQAIARFDPLITVLNANIDYLKKNVIRKGGIVWDDETDEELDEEDFDEEPDEETEGEKPQTDPTEE